jgi:hypothetical protein
MMPFTWVTPPPTVTFSVGYQNYSQAVFAGIVAVAEKNAKEATAWMKANHPWQNVTGRAEAGLRVDVESEPMTRVEMIFHYGPDVSYDIHLELSRQGLWGILAPAVDLFGPKVMADLKSRAPNVSVTKPMS